MPSAVIEAGEDEHENGPEDNGDEDERADPAVPSGECHGSASRFVFEHYRMTVLRSPMSVLLGHLKIPEGFVTDTGNPPRLGTCRALTHNGFFRSRRVLRSLSWMIATR